MKFAYLIVLAAMLFTGCDLEQRNETRTLKIVNTVENGVHKFSLRNGTNEPVKVSEKFAFAGVGGGNVFLLAMSNEDKLSAPCQVLDSSPYDMTRTLAPGAEVELWHGEASTLADWYCLRQGKHSAVLGYRLPDGSLIFSETFILEAAPTSPNAK